MTTTYCRRSIPTFRCNDFFIMPHNNFPILSYSIIQLQCSRTINQAPARVLHVSQLRKTGPTRIYVPREARKRALDCVASTPTMGLRMTKFESVFSPPAWYPAYALGYRKIFRVQWTEVYSNFLEPATPGRPASGGRISMKQQTAWTGAAFKARERFKMGITSDRMHSDAILSVAIHASSRSHIIGNKLYNERSSGFNVRYRK
jgi:hypothetical protein